MIPKIGYNKIRRDFTSSICGYGGIGRRVRLRGVWITPCGFKSRWPHQKKGAEALKFGVAALFLLLSSATIGRYVFIPLFEETYLLIR